MIKDFIELFDAQIRQPFLVRVDSIVSITGNGIQTIDGTVHFVAESYEEIKQLIKNSKEVICD